MVCAKTRRASKTLSEAFRDRAARKRYRAVLIEYANHRKGGLGKRKINEKRGTITSKDMGPNNDQYAETEFAICDETNEDDNDGGNAIAKVLIDFYPKTGRTHQLRRHAEKQLNMPILGDTRYGDKVHREKRETKKYTSASLRGGDYVTSRSHALARCGRRTFKRSSFGTGVFQKVDGRFRRLLERETL